jgi:lipopolysaccharide/colanic/teichoic acid biosynthesis glycosyltransferase
MRWKRPAEFLVALVALVALAPLLLFVALLVKLTSRGPAIYRQTRTGRWGRPFVIHKFRTMVQNAEGLTGPRWATRDDPRITSLGRFLRRTHLDELPQLWDVLKGAMSLVGPRPERPEFIPQLEQTIPGYRDRLLIRPGMTGLAQLQLPPDSDLTSVARKLLYDLHYLREASFLGDVRIILCTLCYLVGIPFQTASRVLHVPGRDVIEETAPTVVSETELVLQVQSA